MPLVLEAYQESSRLSSQQLVLMHTPYGQPESCHTPISLHQPSRFCAGDLQTHLDLDQRPKRKASPWTLRGIGRQSLGTSAVLRGLLGLSGPSRGHGA